MATDRNVYEIVDDYTVLGQQCSNVYFYQIGVGLVTDIENLLDIFDEQVLPDLLPMQLPAVVHTRTRIRNLFNVAEYAEHLMSVPGTLAGGFEALPSFFAGGFTLARQTPVTRSGKKRYYMGSEANVLGGFWIDAILTLAATLADQLAAPLTIGIVQTLFPVIVKRIEVSPGEYRLPETMAEATVNGVIDGLFSTLNTTQNSRKVGVGS